MNSFQGSERLIFEYIQHHATHISTISAKEIARDTLPRQPPLIACVRKWGIKVIPSFGIVFYAIILPLRL